VFVILAAAERRGLSWVNGGHQRDGKKLENDIDGTGTGGLNFGARQISTGPRAGKNVRGWFAHEIANRILPENRLSC